MLIKQNFFLGGGGELTFMISMTGKNKRQTAKQGFRLS